MFAKAQHVNLTSTLILEKMNTVYAVLIRQLSRKWHIFFCDFLINMTISCLLIKQFPMLWLAAYCKQI